MTPLKSRTELTHGLANLRRQLAELQADIRVLERRLDSMEARRVERARLQRVSVTA